MNQDQKEQRRFPRAGVDIEAEFSAETTSKAKYIPARIIVLGEGGCFLQTKTALSKDKRINMKFTVEGHDVRAIGLVRYIIPFSPNATGPQFPGGGIQFETLSAGADQLIRTFVEKELSSPNS